MTDDDTAPPAADTAAPKPARRSRSRAANALQVDPLYLDEPTTCAMTTLSESTLAKLVREGQFPRPRKISGNRAAWLFTEVREWAQTRPVSDLLPPANTQRRAAA